MSYVSTQFLNQSSKNFTCEKLIIKNILESKQNELEIKTNISLKDVTADEISCDKVTSAVVECDDVTATNIECDSLLVNGQPITSRLDVEFYAVNVKSESNNVTGSVDITGNGTTSYAVFPSVYYGYDGEVYANATLTSAQLNQVVITNITASSFGFALNKSGAVNVYIVFQVVFHSDLTYPKVYGD
jgi:hypothetical protein